MKGSGFHGEKLEFYKGEECREVLRHMGAARQGLPRRLHFKVSRGFGHLNYEAIPSIYGPFEFYRTAYNELHIFDSVAGKWIKEVMRLLARSEPARVPWEPIAVRWPA